MRAYRSILWGAAATAAGIGMCVLGKHPFYWAGHGYWSAFAFGWLYQLIVGGIAVLTGLYTKSVAAHDPKLITKEFYLDVGWPLILVGGFVLVNVDRYDEGFTKLGAWPIYVIGCYVAFAAFFSFMHYLTVFEPPMKTAGYIHD